MLSRNKICPKRLDKKLDRWMETTPSNRDARTYLEIRSSIITGFLVACTRLYKSLCWSVSPSVCWLVRRSRFTFGGFKQFEGRKVRPTNRLTDTVTYRVACTQLMAISLVFSIPTHIHKSNIYIYFHF